MTPQTALDVIRAELAPLAGRSILDIGCGAGALATPLRAEGALWRGLDPGGGPPGLSVDRAGAEAMPYPDASFDAAICVNALHHVPVAMMDRALTEAARVLRPGGRLVVIEPHASGALSRVIAVVDDETRIRQAAQRAMDRCRALRQVRARDYDRLEHYHDFSEFCGRITAVDPGRAGLIAERRAALAEAFEALAGHDAGRRTLAQPMSVRVFQPA